MPRRHSRGISEKRKGKRKERKVQEEVQRWRRRCKERCKGCPRNGIITKVYHSNHYEAFISTEFMLWRTLPVSGFTVYLTYTPIPLLWRRDYLVMEYAMSKGATKEDLFSISRVRGLLCAIFVSDIVTADRKYLEEFATSRTYNRGHTSTYSVPKEATTQEDWITWRQFWKHHAVGNLKLSTPLSEWTHPMHRVWEWYYDKEDASLQQRTSIGTCFYFPDPGYNRISSGKYHVKS